ncbi:DUF3108 domain-containing protein [Kordiimonas lipolytica]|uniref:DUF3108 domain-containing protein n=1 Tax=Kordiimonas lipolytica TaxID=1662421 RepID=A0ABV8U9R3_9PROT|nr:DUF3108 domain-containing protein [Kordiimonas lipolytica]
MRFLLSLTAFSLLSGFATPTLAAPERIEATYDLIWKGFHVSTAETVTELDGSRYFLGINIKTHGLLKMATGGHGTFEISGQLLPDGGVQTESLDADGYWDGDAFSQKLRYGADGHLAAYETKRPEDWLEKNAREAVPVELKTGPDPASLFVSLMQNPINFRAEAMDQPILLRSFDGEAVVDWQLGCAAKPVALKRSKHSPIAGQAYECALETTTVAGKLLKEEKKKKLVKRGPRGRRQTVDLDDVTPKVWLMAMGDGDRLMPVRAQVPSEKGVVGLYLSKLTMDSADGADIGTR